MAGMLRRAAAGLGKGLAEVGLMGMKSTMDTKRQERLEALRAKSQSTAATQKQAFTSGESEKRDAAAMDRTKYAADATTARAGVKEPKVYMLEDPNNPIGAKIPHTRVNGVMTPVEIAGQSMSPEEQAQRDEHSDDFVEKRSAWFSADETNFGPKSKEEVQQLAREVYANNPDKPQSELDALIDGSIKSKDYSQMEKAAGYSEDSVSPAKEKKPSFDPADVNKAMGISGETGPTEAELAQEGGVSGPSGVTMTAGSRRQKTKRATDARRDHAIEVLDLPVGTTTGGVDSEISKIARSSAKLDRALSKAGQPIGGRRGARPSLNDIENAIRYAEYTNDPEMESRYQDALERYFPTSQ